jgi:L-fuconolactonase
VAGAWRSGNVPPYLARMRETESGDAPVVDAHVHFWDPEELHCPWLAEVPALGRRFGPAEYGAASGWRAGDRVVFVEANCRRSDNIREAVRITWLAAAEPRIAGIVAYADLSDRATLPASLDALERLERVRGIRHNIQGEPPGFCVSHSFVDGVREVGRRGLTFDLCATHDQLGDVATLAERCPDTRLVLDHCGKPAIAAGSLEPWRERIRALAALGNVWCKFSGLLTEAGPQWTEADLRPYAEHVVASFGDARVMFGSDWPVLNLAGSFADWHGFTRRFTAGWSAEARRRFEHDNAAGFYGL